MVWSWPWILNSLFIFKHFPWFLGHYVCCLFSQKHFVKLIWYSSVVVFILPRTRIFVLCFEDGCPLNRHLKYLFFLSVRNSFHMSYRTRFFLLCIVKVWTWTYCIKSVSLKSGSFWVEISFIAFVKAVFLIGVSIIRTWAWNFYLFNTFCVSKPIICRGKARRYWFTSFKLIVIVSWSWLFFSFFSTDLIWLFPGWDAFWIETWLRVIMKSCSFRLARFYFSHLVILVFSKAKIINRNRRHWLLHLRLMMVRKNMKRSRFIDLSINFVLTRSRLLLKNFFETMSRWFKHWWNLLLRFAFRIHIQNRSKFVFISKY